jgi:hypothetical protein
MKCITDNCKDDSMNDAELFCNTCFIELSDVKRLRIMRLRLLEWRKKIERKGRKTK